MTAPRQRLSRRAGLTLAELLVALVIGGLTLVITAQAASSVRQWGARLTREEQANSKTMVLYQFAADVLSQALPLPFRDEDGQESVLFEGGEHAVRFVRAEPGYPSRAGLYQYHLHAARTGQTWSLVLERSLLTAPAQFGAMEEPVSLTLYEGPHAPGFAYFDGADWQTAWPRSARPPALVRFTLQGWPGLSIAVPQAAAAPGARTASIAAEEGAARRKSAPGKARP